MTKMTMLLALAAMAILANDVSAFTSPLATRATTSSTPWQTIGMTTDDSDDGTPKVKDVDVDDVVDSAYELLASVDSMNTTAPTETIEETSSATSSGDLSWSELFQEVGNAALLLGGAAVKKASEAVPETISAPKLNLSAVDISIPKTVTNMNLSQITQGTSEWKNALDGAFDGFSLSNAASAAKKAFKADVSIDYDGAAKLAYEEWQEKYGSGGQAALPPDEEDETPLVVYTIQERFEFFQERYNNVTIQNVIEKKKQRDGLLVDENGTAVPMQLDELDKYADLSPEEYARVLKSLEPKSWGEIFGGLANSLASTASSLAETVKENAPKQTKPVAKKAAPKVSTTSSSPRSSIFGSLMAPSKAKAATKKAPVKKKAAPAKKASPRKPVSKVRGAEKAAVSRPTIALFSSPEKKAESKKKQAKVKAATTTTTASNPFSFFGGGTLSPATAKKNGVAKAKKKAAPKGPPTLTNWKQNPDGSITGRISNSPNFRNGTKITTSPVRKGARKGSIIKTGSGSQYKLS